MGKYWHIVNGKRKRTKAGNKHEYEAFGSSSRVLAAQSSRVKARREAMKKGLVHKGDGKEIDHINSDPTDSRASNLRVVPHSVNEGKREKSRLKGSKRAPRRRKRS